ncbi:MAG: hypothetical protein HKN29_01970 [Rhodothermales bacterium]|nr:hypothetical protein [Rhodothermales bacterium]
MEPSGKGPGKGFSPEIAGSWLAPEVLSVAKERGYRIKGNPGSAWLVWSDRAGEYFRDHHPGAMPVDALFSLPNPWRPDFNQPFLVPEFAQEIAGDARFLNLDAPDSLESLSYAEALLVRTELSERLTSAEASIWPTLLEIREVLRVWWAEWRSADPDGETPYAILDLWSDVRVGSSPGLEVVDRAFGASKSEALAAAQSNGFRNGLQQRNMGLEVYKVESVCKNYINLGGQISRATFSQLDSRPEARPVADTSPDPRFRFGTQRGGYEWTCDHLDLSWNQRIELYTSESMEAGVKPRFTDVGSLKNNYYRERKRQTNIDRG